MPQQIILRRGLAADWTSANPVLEPGEVGVETDTGKLKVGNSAGDAWVDLPYVNPTIPAIPSNLSDLADVSDTAPSIGEVLKWDGAQWVPGTDAGGTGGGATLLDQLDDVVIDTPVIGEVLQYDGATWVNAAPAAGVETLNDLTDVAVGTPSIGQVLKWNGAQWGNAGETAQTVSLTQPTTSPRFTLSNGGGNLVLAPGNGNVTFTSDSLTNTVTLSTDNTEYLFAPANTTSTQAGGISFTPLEAGTGVQGTPVTITFRDSNTAEVRKADAGGLIINARNTTYNNTVNANVSGVVLTSTGKIEASGLVATLVSGETTITVTTGSVLPLYQGLSLIKTAGTGEFGTEVKIVSVDSFTNTITVDTPHATSGEITFSSRYLHNTQFSGDVGMTVTSPQPDVILFTPEYKVATGTVNRIAMYGDGANLNTVGPSNAGLEYDNASRYLIVTSGRLALRQTDLQMIHDSYGTGARSDGLQYAMYYDTNTASRAWNFIRGRGTSIAPQPVQVGDELFQIRSYAQYNTNPTGLSIGSNIRSVVVNVGTNQVGSDLRFSTSNGTTAASVRMKITHDGIIQANNLQAFTTNGDLNILANGTGYVRLPSNTTVGGVAVGAIAFAGSVADATARAALTPSTGQVYIQQDNLHGYLWDGAAWIDLGTLQGPTGAAGTNGTDGSAATIAVGTVTTGAAGSSATVTNSGDSTTAVFDFAIPRGDTGAQGDAATIAVGTVTTLTAGSSATVTNSGTTGAAVFDFGIPAGAAGTNGAGVVAGGTAGQVLAKIDADDYNTEWVDAFDGAFGSLTGTPTTLAGYGITDALALTDFSVITAAAGTAALSYNNTSGEFTFTPPDLSGYLTSYTETSTLDDVLGRGATSTTTAVIPFYYANQTAFPNATTYHGALAHSHADGAMYFAHSGTWNRLANASELGGGGGGIALTDLSVITAAAGTAALSYNNTSGEFTFTPPDLSGYALTSAVPSNLADLADVGSATPTTGDVLKWDGAQWAPAADATGGGSGTLAARTTTSGSTSSLADGTSGPINLTGFSSYMLMKVQTSAAAWVRIYTSEAARIADASRVEGTDPAPGAGVIAEVITTGAQTILISPGALGFNDESPVTTNIPVRVTNKSGSTAVITVTLTLLQLEA